MSFLNKTIAITGGASGIGLATAKALARHGASISIADIQGGKLGAAAEAIRAESCNLSQTKVHAMKVDVGDSRSVNEWVKSTIAELGPLTGAVNLAGLLGRAAGKSGIMDLEDHDWNESLRINLTGVMYCLRAQLRAMEPGGSIVNTSSVGGLTGFAKNSAYVASKHGVIGLTKSAAKEAAENNIRVNCIAPGTIDTPMVQNFDVEGAKLEAQSIPLGRAGKPEEVAELIVWLLSDASSYVTGSTYRIDGGMLS